VHLVQNIHAQLMCTVHTLLAYKHFLEFLNQWVWKKACKWC